MSDTPRRIIGLPVIESLEDLPETARMMVDSPVDSEDTNTGVHGMLVSELLDKIDEAGTTVKQQLANSMNNNMCVLLNLQGGTTTDKVYLGGNFRYNPSSASLTVGSRKPGNNGFDNMCIGYYNQATGQDSLGVGSEVTGKGHYGITQGKGTISSFASQHVFGEYNEEDPHETSYTLPNQRGDYVEIVGNGSDNNNRSNARTLDWNGNEVLAGKLTVGAQPTNDMDVATKKYVDESGGGGGGTTVVANPQGSATANLNKVQIGSTIYSVGGLEIIDTLEAGETELTIQNNAITTTATYDFFTDAFGVSPTDVEVTTGQIVLTFEEQESDVSVKVRIS